MTGNMSFVHLIDWQAMIRLGETLSYLTGMWVNILHAEPMLLKWLVVRLAF
jgi:hypothetical protein